MAILLPFTQRDFLGGPAGSTQMAMQQIVAGILQGAEKRRKEEQEQTASGFVESMLQNQKNLNDPNNISPIPGAPAPYSDMPSGPTDLIDAIMGNRNLDRETKQSMIKNLGERSDIQYKDIHGKALLETSARAKEPKQYEIEYWDPKGEKPGGKILVSDNSYNQTVQKLADAGYTVNKPEKPTKESYNTVWAYKPDDPESWTPVEYEKGGDTSLIQKMKQEGFRFRNTAPSPNEKGDYFDDKAKLMDDNRGHHALIMKQFTDPMGTVIDSKGYENARKAYEADALKIANSQKPSWATGPEPEKRQTTTKFMEPGTDEEKANYLAQINSGYLLKGKEPGKTLQNTIGEFISDPAREQLYIKYMNIHANPNRKTVSKPAPTRTPSSPTANVSRGVRDVADELRRGEGETGKAGGPKNVININGLTVGEFKGQYVILENSKWRKPNGAENRMIHQWVQARPSELGPVIPPYTVERAREFLTPQRY